MYDFINLTFQFIAVITGIIAVFITILLNQTRLKKAWRSKQVNLTRRKLLKGVIALSVGVAGWGVLQIAPVRKRIQRGIYHFLPQGKNLVVNQKSGVIHHKSICSDHLPKNISEANPITLAANSKFHGSRKVAILSKITEGVSAEDAIEILMLATEGNPTSVHLYDKIIKLLGKIKRYESIHLLLDSADKNLVKLSRQQVEGSKKYNEYIKAISHIQLQKKKARERARYAALKV